MSKWQSERSIHDMLKDTPPLRESSDSITSGTEPIFPTSRSMPFPPAYAPPDVSQNGAASSSTLVRSGSTKLETLRNWGVSTYKCTKQILYEKLGKNSRTVDTELEAQIEMLRETQRKYNGLLRLSTTLTTQLAAAGATQRTLGEAFAELAQKSPDLQNHKSFLQILNKCLAYFPKVWKEAVVIILRKPGKPDYTQPKSYRPIGRLSILGKILEKKLIRRIKWDSLPNSNPRQYGFVPQRSTEDALYDLMTHILKNVKNKILNVVVSLDIDWTSFCG